MQCKVHIQSNQARGLESDFASFSISSVLLDYSHPEGDGEPLWACDPQHLDLLDPNFDAHGLYTERAINTLPSLADVQQPPPMAISSSKSPIQAYKHKIKPEVPDFDKYRPYFGWVNADTIRDTFRHTTQWGASVGTFPMKKHLKSRNPALNVPRRHEAVATDTVYSDTPAVDSGVKQAQLFVGKESLVSDIYPLRYGKQFVYTLEDNIRCGAMDKLISDSAKKVISHKVQDILRAYNISDWQSEPHHQNQNPAEWRYRTIKAWTNTIMNRTGAPAYCWLLILQYVCYILNHISTSSLGGQVPLQVLYGITPDISIILLYTFYHPIFYATHDQHFPSDSEERAGYWVGFAEHCGDSLTHKVLDAETLRIIHWSALRPRTLKNPNKRLVDDGGEEDHQSHEKPTKHPTPDPSDTPTVYIKSRHDDGPTSSKPLPEFNPEDLVGRTFLLPPGDNGERLRAKVTRKVVEDIEKADGERIQKLSYILHIGNGKVEELISYIQLVDHLEAAANEDNEISDDLDKFRDLIGHQGPLKPTDPNWKGCKFNVLVEWETGEKTYEPLSILAADDPVTCATYAKENDLLHIEGRKRFRNRAKRDKPLARAVMQSKIRQVRRSSKYMFGYLIPRSYKEALEFDKENNNTKWADATRDEMDCIKEQQVFTKGQRAKWDSNHKKILNAPPNHQKIRVNLIFAVKYNGRHKARLVADGSLTPEPAENIYSGVVSLRHLRLVIFLGELNNLELWGADIGNAYLEAHTQEKLFIIRGAEFEELEGFILIFNKALYGLKSSGKRWAEKFYDIIKDMGFTPSKADPGVWMRENKALKCYEYLAIYVDDLCIAAQDPGQIIQTHKKDLRLKVTGDGPLSHHLGADYTTEKDNTLVCQPKKYIERLAESYHSMFKQNPPKNMRTPLDKTDHPELDDTELLSGESIQHYLTMIGQLQWLVTLDRFDIHAQVTTMSRFRSAPRKGHLERLQRVYGYVLKTKQYSTRYRTEEPDYTYLPDMKHDWSYTVYGNIQEIIPHDCPKPLGKSVTTTTTLDANLLHCMATGASLTACLHLCNQTPTDWYSKKQATVETETYGSEFVAAKTATEQIMDIRYTLRYLGVPIRSKSYMFGDTRSVVTSATLPHSTLSKRHNILAFHRVREAIADKIIDFHWIKSEYNLGDMLSKHWEHSKIFPMIQKLLITCRPITLIPKSATEETFKPP